MDQPSIDGVNTYFVARAALGLRAHDCTAGFRLYRAAVLRKVPIERIRSSGYSFLVEMLTYAQRTGIRIAEVPIVFEDRKVGESTLTWRLLVQGYTTVLKLRWWGLTGRI